MVDSVAGVVIRVHLRRSAVRVDIIHAGVHVESRWWTRAHRASVTEALDGLLSFAAKVQPTQLQKDNAPCFDGYTTWVANPLRS
jgi:hypothetical protein